MPSPWCSGTSSAFPDYQMFLEVARKAGVKLVMFASCELETADLDELNDQIEEADLGPRGAARMPDRACGLCASMKA